MIQLRYEPSSILGQARIWEVIPFLYIEVLRAVENCTRDYGGH
jgi:hypothetical protein